MKLVINIPDYVKEQADDGKGEELGIPLWLTYEIANGTPLPKSHGRLKDIDKIINDGTSKGFCDWYDEMKYAPTIIEADKAESEDKE